MAVIILNYLIDHGNLNGALYDVLVAGFSGALSGGILGGIMGGVQFKMTYTKLSESEVRQILSDRGLDDSAGKDMFRMFNQPALDDAVNAGKNIRFSHDPTAYGECALKWEWDYLQNNHGFSDIL